MSATAYLRDGGQSPTLIIRTPYWKLYAEPVAFALATQGFNVIAQDCRGRYGSGGEFPFGAFEDYDGAELVGWLAEQGFGWFDAKRVVMWGISYLGITQYATVAGLEKQRVRRAEKDSAQGIIKEHSRAEQTPKLAAIAPLFSASSVHDVFFANNAFKLDFYLRYMQLMTRPTTLMAQATLSPDVFLFKRRLAQNLVPCLGMKKLHQGLKLPYLFKYNPRHQSRFWLNRDYSDARLVAPPTYIGTGWHDIFLQSSLNDYQTLVKLHGTSHARMVIGPWHHLESILSNWAFTYCLRTTLEFLQEKVGLKEPGACTDKPVRLWIMGSRSHKGYWQDFASWPVNGTREAFFVLAPGSLGLNDDEQPMTPVCSTPSRAPSSSFRYDPLDPTPSLGGSIFSVSDAGEIPQNNFADRADVLKFDTPVLPTSITIVGHPRLRLSIRTSRPYFDIFARLVDVHPDGKSYNICDGILRHKAPPMRSQSHGDFKNPGQAAAVEEEELFTASVDVQLAATAKCFEAGHTIRLLIMGGAFPAYARHFGDAEQVLEPEPLEVHPCMVEIMHTDQVPSALWLPVLSGPVSFPRTLAEATAGRRARRYSKDFEVGLRRVQSEAACAG